MTTRLLIIDPQVDFLDIPGAALPVTGANADMNRLAAFIRRNSARLADIQVTLDSHTPYDIAHPSWWVDPAGNNPAPFTAITRLALEQGNWKPADPNNQGWAERYIDKVESNFIWPMHCLIGTPGHNIQENLSSALNEWSLHNLKGVNMVTKGLNPATEHFSAVKALVPIIGAKETDINFDIIIPIMETETTLIAGEALSHCVKATIEDILAICPAAAEKITLLLDASSPVPGFENVADAFLLNMTTLGVRISSTDAALS